jgi:glycerol kinase
MNLHTLAWDEELLATFRVPASVLPRIVPSAGLIGTTKGLSYLPDGIPIAGIAGDQQAALFGQACFTPGEAKCTYGTGAFLLMNTGSKPRMSRARLLSTVAWTGQGGSVTYALEGSAFMAGAVVQWLRDGLGMIRDSAEIEALASSVASSEGVVFVPAFTGLGAPYWNPNARAMISGLTRGSTRAHIARAALEGIALQNVDILQAMEKDLGSEVRGLCVDGGACKNDLLMQVQSDLLGRKLFRPEFTETTAMGAVFAAGLGVGIWNSVHEVKKAWRLEREFAPLMKSEERSRAVKQWNQAVARVQLDQ